MLIEIKCDSYYANTYIEVSTDDSTWTRIAQWNVYSASEPGNLNEPQAPGSTLYALSPIDFRYVRVGTDVENWASQIRVDAVMLDGQVILGVSVREDINGGSILNKDNVLLDDTNLCTINTANGGNWNGISVDFGSLQTATGGWPDESIDTDTFVHGLYMLGHSSSDPASNPPGETYEPNPKAIAAYDWGLVNNGNKQLFDDIRAINSSWQYFHKINMTIVQRALTYYYDPAFRTTYNQEITDEVNTYSWAQGFSLSEEEYFYQFNDYNADPTPQFMLDWSSQLLTDTGIDVTVNGWASTGTNARDMREFLGNTAGVFYFDSIYDVIKGINPAYIVQQFIVGNTWRWTVPEDMKRDQWHGYVNELVLWFTRTLNYKSTDYPVSWTGPEHQQLAWRCRTVAGMAGDTVLARLMTDAGAPNDSIRDLPIVAEGGISKPYYLWFGSFIVENPDSMPTFNDTDPVNWTVAQRDNYQLGWDDRLAVEQTYVMLTAKVGDTLRANNGTWLNAVSYTYKWFIADDMDGLNASEIVGATTDGYVVRIGDAEKWIAAEVTATNTTGDASLLTLYAWIEPAVVQAFIPSVHRNANQFLQIGGLR